MNNIQTKIAVLITSFNRKQNTLSCLDHLYRNKLIPNVSFNVFLVDDGSTDGTAVAVKREYPNTKLIQGDGQLYWNRGMYTAWVEAAKSYEHDFYLWLNDDTDLLDDAILNLLLNSNKLNNKAIIVGSTVDNLYSNVITYGGRIQNIGLIKPDNKIAQECDFFNGNIVLIPQFVYKKLGILDKKFHHALGDFDYGLRAKKLGISSYISPGFYGICKKHNEFPTWCNPDVKLKLRFKHLYTPTGNNPFEFFIFDKRHNGWSRAIIHFFTIHLRTFFPKMWERRKGIDY